MVYRCALITGATSGIGKAFAQTLPLETNLVITGRTEAMLETLRDSLASAGREIVIVPANLATQAGRERVVAAADAAGIDLLVNNAGLGCFGALIDNSLETELAMTEVNVVAPVILTRALLPGMISRAEASGSRAGVILVSSVAGFNACNLCGHKGFRTFICGGAVWRINPRTGRCVSPMPWANTYRFFSPCRYKRWLFSSYHGCRHRCTARYSGAGAPDN